MECWLCVRSAGRSASAACLGRLGSLCFCCLDRLAINEPVSAVLFSGQLAATEHLPDSRLVDAEFCGCFGGCEKCLAHGEILPRAERLSTPDYSVVRPGHLPKRPAARQNCRGRRGILRPFAACWRRSWGLQRHLYACFILATCKRFSPLGLPIPVCYKLLVLLRFV